jgi:uncharacterized protein HemX
MKSEANSHTPLKWLSISAIFFSLVSLSGLGFLGFQLLNAKQQQIDARNQQRGQLLQQNMQITQLEQQLTETSNITHTLLQHMSTDRVQRTLNNVTALLNLANLELSIHLDTQQATASLHAAQIQLNTINDARLLKVKHSLQTTLTQLHNMSSTNTTQLITQIDALGQLIQSAPMLPQPTSHLHATNITKNVNTPWYKHIGPTLLQTLREVITIHHTDPKLALLLEPQQQQLLQQIIKSHLLLVQLAVIQRNDTLYHHQLNQLTQLITTHYTPSNQQQSVITQIKQLSAVKLSFDQTPINKVMNQLNQAILLMTQEAPAKKSNLPAPPKHTPSTLPAKPATPAANPGVSV